VRSIAPGARNAGTGDSSKAHLARAERGVGCVFQFVLCGGSYVYLCVSVSSPCLQNQVSPPGMLCVLVLGCF